MTISNDPEKRKWIDLIPANPNLVTEFRPTLVSFIAFSRDRVPRFAGTGFIMSGSSEFAIVLTAKHVLQEGVLRIQKPEAGAASANPFVIASTIVPSLDPKKLKVVWGDGKSAFMLDVVHVEYNDSLDIAVCLVMPQEEESNLFVPYVAPLDISIPKVGETIHMASLDRLKAFETQAPSGPNGAYHAIKLMTRVCVRIGTVTGVYPKGFRQYRWPCFTTSIPAEPGMSGGFVFLPKPTETVGACGVVCADNSSKAARKNYHKAGESVIAMSWPALCLRVPTWTANDAPQHSLHHLMLDGAVTRAMGGLERVEIIEGENGTRTIALKEINSLLQTAHKPLIE